MNRNRNKCEVCDKVPAEMLSPRGWCQGCENEFHEWRARLPVECPRGECPTPLGCRILKQCAARERYNEVEADIKADPDLTHVHNAADID